MIFRQRSLRCSESPSVASSESPSVAKDGNRGASPAVVSVTLQHRATDAPVERRLQAAVKHAEAHRCLVDGAEAEAGA